MSPARDCFRQRPEIHPSGKYHDFLDRGRPACPQPDSATSDCVPVISPCEHDLGPTRPRLYSVPGRTAATCKSVMLACCTVGPERVCSYGHIRREDIILDVIALHFPERLSDAQAVPLAWLGQTIPAMTRLSNLGRFIPWVLPSGPEAQSMQVVVLRDFSDPDLDTRQVASFDRENRFRRRGERWVCLPAPRFYRE